MAILTILIVLSGIISLSLFFAHLEAGIHRAVAIAIIWPGLLALGVWREAKDLWEDCS